LKIVRKYYIISASGPHAIALLGNGVGGNKIRPKDHVCFQQIGLISYKDLHIILRILAFWEREMPVMFVLE
jgi:hypothetical protein